MKLSTSEVTVVWEKREGEKAGFGKTCPWAGGMMCTN